MYVSYLLFLFRYLFDLPPSLFFFLSPLLIFAIATKKRASTNQSVNPIKKTNTNPGEKKKSNQQTGTYTPEWFVYKLGLSCTPVCGDDSEWVECRINNYFSATTNTCKGVASVISFCLPHLSSSPSRSSSQKRGKISASGAVLNCCNV